MLNESNNYTCNLPLFQNQSIREMNSLCSKFLTLYSEDKDGLTERFFESSDEIKDLISKFSNNLSFFNSEIDISLQFKNVFTKYLSVSNTEILYHRITVI